MECAETLREFPARGLQGCLYDEGSFWPFLIVTVLIGGWAAWMTARGVAGTWRPYWQCALAMLALGAVVRFLHFALFEGTVTSLRSYVTGTLILLAIGSAGFRMTRARQMTTQYRWLYERTGPFGWRERTPDPEPTDAPPR